MGRAAAGPGLAAVGINEEAYARCHGARVGAKPGPSGSGTGSRADARPGQIARATRRPAARAVTVVSRFARLSCALHRSLADKVATLSALALTRPLRAPFGLT